ncbi:hypothetical protein LCGC14_2817280 [marine sediment metagenome]|uniref:Uncharacterized protein n=1 Tax=marine sediment metagenome TaxID=412755 RepID=A0A0F9ARH7_9ZZZZ
MLLSVPDRLVLLNVLPAEGDVTMLRILRELTSALSFTEIELAKLKFKANPGPPPRTEWVENAVGDVDIEIGPRAYSLIAERFERLNKEKKMTLDLLPAYEKFESKE